MRKWAYLAPYILPVLLLLGYQRGGGFHYAVPIFVFVCVPVLDMIIGRYKINQSETVYAQMKKASFYKVITYAFVPIQFALVVWGAYVVSARQLNNVELVGFILSVGIITGGVGITLAHELGHRASRLEQRLAQALLLTVNYMHFFIEHNQGHHVRVATKADPATARFGESFYAFYPRTLWGGLQNAWRLEQRRLKRGRRPFYHNRIIYYLLLPLLMAGSLALVWGASAFVFFYLQAFIAVTLLELINYIEHYGLERGEQAPGKFEKVRPEHSWNAGEFLTNSLLFELQRHSDHHANAARHYQTLRHVETSPQLPTGYAGMIWLALLPPLWRAIMDPRVENFRTAAG